MTKFDKTLGLTAALTALPWFLLEVTTTLALLPRLLLVTTLLVTALIRRTLTTLTLTLRNGFTIRTNLTLGEVYSQYAGGQFHDRTNPTTSKDLGSQ